jgi:hypothetical protein
MRRCAVFLWIVKHLPDLAQDLPLGVHVEQPALKLKFVKHRSLVKVRTHARCGPLVRFPDLPLGLRGQHRRTSHGLPPMLASKRV